MTDKSKDSRLRPQGKPQSHSHSQLPPQLHTNSRPELVCLLKPCLPPSLQLDLPPLPPLPSHIRLLPPESHPPPLPPPPQPNRHSQASTVHPAHHGQDNDLSVSQLQSRPQPTPRNALPRSTTKIINLLTTSTYLTFPTKVCIHTTPPPPRFKLNPTIQEKPLAKCTPLDLQPIIDHLTTLPLTTAPILLPDLRCNPRFWNSGVGNVLQRRAVSRFPDLLTQRPVMYLMILQHGLTNMPYFSPRTAIIVACGTGTLRFECGSEGKSESESARIQFRDGDRFEFLEGSVAAYVERVTEDALIHVMEIPPDLCD